MRNLQNFAFDFLLVSDHDTAILAGKGCLGFCIWWRRFGLLGLLDTLGLENVMMVV